MRCINCMREVKDSGVCPHCGFDAATYKPPDNALPPGSVLKDEQYIVGRALGHGGFGITYAALDRNLGLPVAIKECLPQRGAWRDASNTSVQWSVPAHEQESAMENLVREARKMAQIYGISGVVPVREYFYDNETAYIVMDYVDGEMPTPKPHPKSALAVLIALALLVSVFAVVMFLRREPPAEIVASGECGERVSWTLDANGLLTISGAGNMTDYEWIKDENTPTTPWFNDRDSIFNVRILSGITSIGNYALYKCSNLQSIKIPDSIMTIGHHAFYNCSGLTSVKIPNSVTEIGWDAFYNCSGLTSIKISNNVTKIATATFQGCSSLTNVEIPDSVTAIGTAAFYECGKLSNVTLSSHIGQISADCFGKCSSLENVTIPDSVTTIGASAFNSCKKLESVTIPNSVTTIGKYAFYNCSNLSSASVPAKLNTSSVFGSNTTVTRRKDSTADGELDALNEEIKEEIQQSNITF